MNRQKQQGLTMISWIVALIFVGIFALMILRVGPMYMDYYKVVQVLEMMKTELQENKMTEKQVRISLNKRFDTAYVSFIKKEYIKIYRGSGSFSVGRIDIDYEAKERFFDQIYFVGYFHASTNNDGKKNGYKYK